MSNYLIKIKNNTKDAYSKNCINKATKFYNESEKFKEYFLMYNKNMEGL